MARFLTGLSPTLCWIAVLFMAGIAHGEAPKLMSGPLVGYSNHFDTAVWVQTNQPTRVRLTYWPLTEREKLSRTPYIHTGIDDIALVRVENLSPGTEYGFRVDVGSDGANVSHPSARFQTQPLWRRFKGRGAPNFSVAFGSCSYTTDEAYDPKPYYGGGYDIYDSIAQQNPDLMLWLGDNVYFRPSDWASSAGMQRRYRRTRQLKHLQALLATTHTYATWDDHDYGPNDSNWSFANKSASLGAFKLYWANPSYGLPELPGVFTHFTWGDVDFFMLDNRWYRSASSAPRTAAKEQFGKGQIRWLLDALSASRAPFKIVAAGGQFLSPFDKWEGSAQFPHETNELIDRLIKRRIGGVLFLSGDRHHTELVKVHPKGFYPLFDFTASPLTSRPASADGEWDSSVRVPGTLVTKKRNFGLLKFSGSDGQRMVTLESRDKAGRLLWSQTIGEQMLRVPEPKGSP